MAYELQKPRSFDDLIVPAYHRAFDLFVSRTTRELWLAGGRASIKSTVAAYLVALLMMMHRGVSAMVLRKHSVDIRTSVYPQIRQSIAWLAAKFPEQRIEERWKFREDGRLMTFDGSRGIVFHGLDDPQKRKSEKPPWGGYFGGLWCEELDEFSPDEISSVRKSVLRGGPIGQSIYTFNPPQSSAAWVNAESARSKPGRHVFKTTYLDILPFHPEWLGDTFLKDAEDLKASDEKRYRHELLGEATGTGGEIFTNVEAGVITDEMVAAFRERGQSRIGIDFGFTNDPTVILQSAYVPEERTIYVFGEWRRHGQFTEQIHEAIVSLGIQRDVMIADSAEKRVIGELRYRGDNVRASWKSPAGWREDGLRWLRSRRRIVVDTARCPGAWGELVHYEYDRYGNGEFKTQYPDGNDHAIDALRYGHETDIRRGMIQFASMPVGKKRVFE